MQQQPRFQSHQSVKVNDQAHERHGQAGVVVDVNETKHFEQELDSERQPVRGPDGQPVAKEVVTVGVRFDDDGHVLSVPIDSLQILN